jgi:hypothetical protein
MKHPRIYSLLKSAGFSAFKAAEILLDASCGDSYALWFVRIAFRGRR